MYFFILYLLSNCIKTEISMFKRKYFLSTHIRTVYSSGKQKLAVLSEVYLILPLGQSIITNRYNAIQVRLVV